VPGTQFGAVDSQTWLVHGCDYPSAAPGAGRDAGRPRRRGGAGGHVAHDASHDARAAHGLEETAVGLRAVLHRIRADRGHVLVVHAHQGAVRCGRRRVPLSLRQSRMVRARCRLRSARSPTDRRRRVWRGLAVERARTKLGQPRSMAREGAAGAGPQGARRRERPACAPATPSASAVCAAATSRQAPACAMLSAAACGQTCESTGCCCVGLLI